MQDLPGPLRLTSAFPFVGRTAELRRLRQLMPRDARRVALLGGEPGSGKSRLVRELAADAAREDVLVLYGACDAVVQTPYGPFVEALDHLARVTDAATLRAALGTGGGELTRLLPDLPARVGELPPPVEADHDTVRHRLHTTVADLLTGIGRREPVLLVLEDCHWADHPTLLLLQYLARTAPDARLLVLATFRDTEAEMPQTLADALADLRRSEDVVRMRLEGLSLDEVAEFVRRAAGGASPELAQAIGDLTGGNPFLVCELWRALVETGFVEADGGAVRLAGSPRELGTPESVREVVSRRLARLQPPTARLLELAATAGNEFELDVIRRADPDADILGALDEAVRSGMIEELPSPTLAYRFTHELVRRALYDRLGGVRRAELHLRVGEALEGGAGRSTRTLADLAHHFTAAAALGGPERAVDYSVLAARAAIRALAFDEAVARLSTALELGIENPQERAEALLQLGTAAHRAGKAPDAQEALRGAAQIAREQGDAELLARAAIGFEDASWRPGIPNQGASELLEEATAALGGASSQLRVRLLGGLARTLDFHGEHERAAVVRRSAIAMAHELGDRAGLATVLMRAYWSRPESSLEQILAWLNEAATLGEELGDTEIRAEAMSWRVPTYIALGDIDAARRQVVALLQIAEFTAQPFMLHVACHYGSAIALNDGDLDASEALAQRSNEASRLLSGRDASGVHGIQMFSLRREQGRLAELAPLLRMLGGGAWRPGLVALLAELGNEDEARRELARVRAGGLDPYRSLWLASLTYLTDAAAALGDQETAALLYPQLAPHAGTHVMVGHLVSCYGAADRYLGMLAATLGEHEQAERHFERAADINRRAGMVTWLGRTLYEHARARLARGRDAGALLDEAAALAGDRLPALAARIAALRPAATVPLPDGLSSREAQILSLVARGLSNREIGGALSISEHTAANHIRSILRKTGCANRTQAATYAHRHGLVEV
jgi:DNA-binding CsgD family transcriptional regulator